MKCRLCDREIRREVECPYCGAKITRRVPWIAIIAAIAVGSSILLLYVK